jgi:acyl-CoA thioesterase-1
VKSTKEFDDGRKSNGGARRWCRAACAVVLVAATTGRAETPGTPVGARMPEANDPRARIADVPGLPRVLLIGDSISLGYTLTVRETLKGKANVHHPPANCGSTRTGLKHLEEWLGDGPWDVIHFNWGLWDINRRVDGKRNVDGPIAISEEEYAQNLEQLVERLKKTGAKLIWANTTFVQGGWGRRAGDEIRYNKIAEEIMRRHGVRINDLHAFTAALPRFGEAGDGPEMWKSAGNVHFSEAGYRAIGWRVAEVIEEVLRE